MKISGARCEKTAKGIGFFMILAKKIVQNPVICAIIIVSMFIDIMEV